MEWWQALYAVPLGIMIFVILLTIFVINPIEYLWEVYKEERDFAEDVRADVTAVVDFGKPEVVDKKRKGDRVFNDYSPEDEIKDPFDG